LTALDEITTTGKEGRDTTVAPFSSVVARDVCVSRANWKLSTAKPDFTKIVDDVDDVDDVGKTK
jgi:hypothetical protein